MASYTGYVSVNHGTYNEWSNNTLNNSYDVDGYYSYQCWDFISLFYYNIGFPQGFPTLTDSKMYTMWDNRYQNITYNGVTYFDLITNINDVEQGDLMVFDASSSNIYGHAGFANQDFTGWTPDPNDPYEFPILSQNNGASAVNIHGYDYRLFLGAFRLKSWQPTPTPISRKPVVNHFPFFITAERRRNGWF